MKKGALLLAGLLFALSGTAQVSRSELWMWKDANGVTHYSDRPVPGARRIELSHVSAPEESTAPVSPADRTPAEDGAAAAVPVEYRLLEFRQPTEGQTFFGADATVGVQLRIEPALADGHSLALYLDGTVVEEAANATSYTLGNLQRGMHTLTAVIQDERGNDLLRSQPRTFNVRQASTIPPAAVGPNLRPPPQPTPRPNAPR